MSEYVLGIDVATTKLALAWLDTDHNPTWHTHTTPKGLDANQRLSYWQAYLTKYGPSFLDEVVTVVVEVPWAPSRNDFHLLGTAAVVVAALCVAQGPPVLELNAGQWKTRCGLAGNAGKPETLAFARSLGYAGVDGDVADALGCAAAGWSLYERRAAA